MDQFRFVQAISELRPSATFLTLKGYTNEHGEKATYQIVFHMSYSNALQRSLETLHAIEPENDLEVQAKQELMASFQNSLNNNQTNPIEEREDGYTHFTGDAGKIIKGVKLHDATATLHLYGLVVNKKVLVPGVYPKKNQRPLTIAKEKLRRKTSIGNFRQFKLTPNQVESIHVEKLELLPPQ